MTTPVRFEYVRVDQLDLGDEIYAYGALYDLIEVVVGVVDPVDGGRKCALVLAPKTPAAVPNFALGGREVREGFKAHDEILRVLRDDPQ